MSIYACKNKDETEEREAETQTARQTGTHLIRNMGMFLWGRIVINITYQPLQCRLHFFVFYWLRVVTMSPIFLFIT